MFHRRAGRAVEFVVFGIAVVFRHTVSRYAMMDFEHLIALLAFFRWLINRADGWKQDGLWKNIKGRLPVLIVLTAPKLEDRHTLRLALQTHLQFSTSLQLVYTNLHAKCRLKQFLSPFSSPDHGSPISYQQCYRRSPRQREPPASRS